jgi:CheY-like chemotaxis protein
VAVDLRELLMTMLELLRRALRDDIQTQFEMPSELGLVRVDPGQLELALLNLAINARDAMPGGGTFRIAGRNVRVEEGHPLLAPGEYIELTLRDSGVGMPPQVLDKALEPFFTTKAPGRGSGMGLPQAYAFARQAGGLLSLESAPGQGTTATLLLPRVTGVANVASLGDVARERVNGAGRTVLLVEDESLVRELVATALEGYGFKVEQASDAEEALARLEAGLRVDVVFSDVLMPGRFDGVQLADRVTERYGLPVLLATGYTDRIEKIERYPVIGKPYDVAAVASSLVEAASRGERALRTQPNKRPT